MYFVRQLMAQTYSEKKIDLSQHCANFPVSVFLIVFFLFLLLFCISWNWITNLISCSVCSIAVHFWSFFTFWLALRVCQNIEQLVRIMQRSHTTEHDHSMLQFQRFDWLIVAMAYEPMYHARERAAIKSSPGRYISYKQHFLVIFDKK